MGKCITKKDWMTVIRLAIMVILTVWFVYFWQGQAVIAYAAETYGDYELTGHAQNAGNAVEGGYTDPNPEGFVFYYQIVSDGEDRTAAISGYSYRPTGQQDEKPLNLPSTILPEGETEPYRIVGVNGNVFANCVYISSVKFTSTYEWVGAEAFMGCPITTVDFNEGMLELRDRAFYNCSKLTDVLIQVNVNSIGTGVFANCTSLGNISVVRGNERYCAEYGVLYSKNRDNSLDALVQWPAGLLIGSSVSSQFSIGSAEHPVRTIGDCAFEGCTFLQTVEDLYPTITTIGERAFYGCTGLTSIKIPSTVLKIGEQAFSNCSPMLVISCEKDSCAEAYAKSHSITASVTCTVNFYDGSTLLKTQSVKVGDSAAAPVVAEKSGYTLTWDKDYTNVQQNLNVYTAWKQNFTVTFKDGFSGQVTEVTSYYGGAATPPVWTREGYILAWDTTSYTYVKNNLTVNAVWLISMTDGIITEEKPQVGDTRTINYVTYQVTSVSESDPRVKVMGCTKQTLTMLSIPTTITFGGTNFKVTNIAAGAFRDLPNLTTLYIGKNVTKINRLAFYHCPKLKKITIASKKLTAIGEKAFSKTYAKAKVNVSNAYIKKYQTYLQDAGLSIYATVF